MLHLNRRRSFLLLCFLLVLTAPLKGQTSTPSQTIDVVHYDITLEPDIAQKTLTGTTVIKFTSNVQGLNSVEFDCGNLTVDSVKQSGVPRQFSISDHHLRVSLPPLKRAQSSELSIAYHGAPKWGIRFFPDLSQVYTVFSTSQWTVCIDAPEDRATLKLTLIVPAKLTALSNGELISTKKFGDKQKTIWEQKSSIPTYIFGFTIGPFRTVREKPKGVENNRRWDEDENQESRAELFSNSQKEKKAADDFEERRHQ